MTQGGWPKVALFRPTEVADPENYEVYPTDNVPAAPETETYVPQSMVDGLVVALESIDYWANVQFEDSGEMGVAVDRIANIVGAALATFKTQTGGTDGS